MTFPLPKLGVHTAIFGGAGTGKSSLLKGLCVEAARTRHVRYTSLEDALSTPQGAELTRAGISILDPEVFAADKLADHLAESIIAIDAVHFLTVRTPFGIATSAGKVQRFCQQASAMGSSLVVTFQLNRTAALKPETVREAAPWGEFANQWVLNNRPDVDAPNGHLRAKCVRAASAGTVGTVFSFRPWR